MVMGLQLINTPTEIYEEFVQVKQHKGKFRKDAGCRTKCHLELVCLDVCVPVHIDYIGGKRYFVTFIVDHNVG